MYTRIKQFLDAVPRALTSANEIYNFARNKYKQIMGVFPDGLDDVFLKRGAAEMQDTRKKVIKFPELRRVALQQYDYWKPESVIIESKASGLPLTYELRQMNIPVINFTPSKGNDKHARVNAVAPLFESGMIWAPDQKFAEEVVEECAAFPNGAHDDLVDSTTQAIMRFRQGGLIQHPEDYIDEKKDPRPRTYY